MKLIFFPPHFRLIALFIAGLLISTLAQVWLLSWLNAICFLALWAWLCWRSNAILSYAKRFFALYVFIALIWLTLSWQLTPQGWQPNPQGIHTALLISLKMHLLLCLIQLLLMDISDTILVQAVSQLPLPKKLISLFVLTVRYIALLSETQRKMSVAMRARGYRHRCHRRTLYVITQQVTLLLIKALTKTEKAQMALKARGFRAD